MKSDSGWYKCVLDHAWSAVDSGWTTWLRFWSRAICASVAILAWSSAVQSDEYDRTCSRKRMSLAFRLEGQQLRTGKWHQSLDELCDACPDRRPPFDVDPTNSLPISVPVPGSRAAPGAATILIKARDMLQASGFDRRVDATCSKFLECCIENFDLKFSKMTGSARL